MAMITNDKDTLDIGGTLLGMGTGIITIQFLVLVLVCLLL